MMNRTIIPFLVLLLVNGCAESYFIDSGQSVLLPDGSLLRKYVSSEPLDKGGCQVAHGEALVQTQVTMGVPHSEIAGWALTNGPTTGCATAQMVTVIGAGVAGGAIIAGGAKAIQLPSIVLPSSR